MARSNCPSTDSIDEVHHGDGPPINRPALSRDSGLIECKAVAGPGAYGHQHPVSERSQAAFGLRTTAPPTSENEDAGTGRPGSNRFR